MITGKTIAKGALVVMAATLLSRLFGFLRTTTIAEFYGLKGTTDAYLVAFSAPSGLGLAVAAALSAGVIPVLNKYLVENDRGNAAKVVNTLINTVLLALLAVTALGMFFAPDLARVMAPGFEGDAVKLTAELIRIMFPGLIFMSLMGIASGYLNSRQHFLLPALGPMVTSVVIIGAVVLFGRQWGIKGLAVGTLAGFVAQLAIQFPAMYRQGFRYRPDLALYHPGVVQVLKLTAPVLAASLVPPCMVLIEKAFASKLTTGSISALDYAFRLMQLPQGLFVMAVSVPLFPALSAFAAQKDFARLKETLVKGISVVAVVMIPASAGLIALDEPIVRLLFERGAFRAKDTVPTAYALGFYALALLPLAIRDIFRRGFYALQDTFTPVAITFLGFALNITFDVVLVNFLGVGGLALGMALSVLVEAAVLYFVLNGRLQRLPGRSFAILLLKLFAASAIMGGAVYLLSNTVGSVLDLGTGIGRLVQVGLPVGVGLGVYLAALIIFRVREIREAGDLLKGLFRRVAGKSG